VRTDPCPNAQNGMFTKKTGSLTGTHDCAEALKVRDFQFICLMEMLFLKEEGDSLEFTLFICTEER